MLYDAFDNTHVTQSKLRTTYSLCSGLHQCHCSILGNPSMNTRSMQYHLRILIMSMKMSTEGSPVPQDFKQALFLAPTRDEIILVCEGRSGIINPQSKLPSWDLFRLVESLP
jgi:hypothetical protein